LIAKSPAAATQRGIFYGASGVAITPYKATPYGVKIVKLPFHLRGDL
jgi:hypothetical protein